MSWIYEKYIKWKKGIDVTSTSNPLLRIFRANLTDDQMITISRYIEYISGIALLFGLLSFAMGVFFGMMLQLYTNI